jgi:alkylation response protein AidB-like acyl-CoA dehydrogenase
VDFTLTSEQQMIKESVERFVAERAAGADRWAEFAELGWLGIGVPETAGGFGGPVETLILMEAFGRGLVTEPYATGAVAAGAILAQAHRADLLEALVTGERRFALAYDEPDARYDPAVARTTAEARDRGYRLFGRKVHVVIAPGSATLIVSASCAGELALFAVAPETGGVTRRDRPAEDGGLAASVDFDAVELPAEARIDAPGRGRSLLEHALDRATGALCAEAVGVMSMLF